MVKRSADRVDLEKMPKINTLLGEGLFPVAGQSSINTAITAANGKALTPAGTEGFVGGPGAYRTKTNQKVAGGGFTTENPGERLFKHKDHFHTEQTDTKRSIKVAGPGTADEEGNLQYAGRSGGAVDDQGNAVAPINPDAEGGTDGEPTEEDVMRASLAAQRKSLRKGQLRGRLSTIMSSKFNKTNQLG